MSDFVSMPDLASYPGVVIKSPQTAELVLRLTNGLFAEVVAEMPDARLTVPTRVLALALEVAARGLRNVGNAESITTGIDDWKKTVRYRSDDSGMAGVYLSPLEEGQLRERMTQPAEARVQRPQSIRLGVPGVSRGAFYC